MKLTPPTYERTSCSCARCASHCRRQPGMMGPGDVDALAAYTGRTVEDLSATALVATLGAVRLIKDDDMAVLAVPTITPAQREDGACVFLTEDNLCSVHAVSPMGCRYFDAHLSEAESDERTFDILLRIYTDFDLHALRDHLIASGRVKRLR